MAPAARCGGDRDEWRKDWFDDRSRRHVPVFSRGIYVKPGATVERVVGVRTTDGRRPHFPGRHRPAPLGPV